VEKKLQNAKTIIQSTGVCVCVCVRERERERERERVQTPLTSMYVMSFPFVTIFFPVYKRVGT